MLIEGRLPVDAPTAFERVVTHDAGGPLDIVQAERLIAEAREEADEWGADPAVLHTGAVALRDAAYEALLDDARHAVQEFVRSPGQGGAEDQGFTITPRPDGGHAVVHVSGLGMEFDARQRWTSREFLLGDAPASMGNATVVVGRTWDGGGNEVLSYRLAGDSRGVARFDVTPIAPDAPDAPDAPFGRFTATDAITGDRHLFGGNGTHTAHDVPVRGGSVWGESRWDGWAYVRREVGAGDEEPRLVDAGSRPWDGWRVQTLSPTRLALIPPGAAPEQRLVINERGRLHEEIAPLRDESGRLTGYARIDHPIIVGLELVERLDDQGRHMVVRPPIETSDVAVATTPEGGLSVRDGLGRTLFTRPALGMAGPDNTVGNPHVIPEPPLREMLTAWIPGEYSSLEAGGVQGQAAAAPDR